MGGKQKQAQRTKGNVRPSSSARAAEMLSASGVASSGFMGFGALSGDLGYVPLAHGAEDVDTSVDPDLRLVMRKMTKRDATTKLKAAQEFSALCKEKDIEAVKSVLSYWPRIFSKASIDHDRRAREATHQAMEQLVLRVRRDLAPIIKQLMGPWLVAQNDSYAPAASAAHAAFQAAFPPIKQTEAIVYCRCEIFNHLEENLFVQSPQTLSDPKTTEPEDMEAKYLRVLASSLSAMRQLILAIPNPQQRDLEDRYRNLLADPKMWKLAKNKSSPIRAALYSVISALCEVHPGISSEVSDKLCPVILHNLDDADPVTTKTLWEAALYVVSKIPDCWKKVNPRKGVLPKLFAILRCGGSGSASIIYPNLLPFLSKIPTDVTEHGIGFYQEFFSNMKNGLVNEKAQQSPSEYAAIVKGYMECLRYVLTTHFDLPHGDVVCDYVIHEQILPLIEASIVDQPPMLANSPLYQMFVDLMVAVEKLHGSTNSTKLVTKSRSSLWDGVARICREHVKMAAHDTVYELDRIGAFLITFRSGRSAVEKKKMTGVRFKDTDDPVPVTKSKPVSVPDISSTTDDLMQILSSEGPVLEMVCKCSVLAFEHCSNLSSLGHLHLISSLCTAYVGVDWTQKMVETAGGDPNSPGLDFEYLTYVLLPWFKLCHSLRTSEKKRKIVSHLGDMVLSVSTSTIATDRLHFMDGVIEEISSPMLLQGVLEQTLAPPKDPQVLRWLKRHKFGEKMVWLTHRLCEQGLQSPKDAHPEDLEDVESSWKLLSTALSCDTNLQPLVEKRYVENIISEIRASLPTVGQMTSEDFTAMDLQHCVSFICDVTRHFFSNMQACVLMPSSEELLVTLFQLGCENMPTLSDELKVKMHSTWQGGVKALLCQRGGLITEGGFFHKTIKYLRQSVADDNHTLDSLDRLSRMTLSLGHCVADYLHPPSFEEEDEEESSENSEEPVLNPDKNYLHHPTIQQLFQELYLPLPESAVPEMWQTNTLVCGKMTLANCPKKKKVPTATLR